MKKVIIITEFGTNIVQDSCGAVGSPLAAAAKCSVKCDANYAAGPGGTFEYTCPDAGTTVAAPTLACISECPIASVRRDKL